MNRGEAVVVPFPFVVSERTRAIKRQLDHPLIDSDGHFVEFMPLLVDFLREEGDAEAVGRFLKTLDPPVPIAGLSLEERRRRQITQKAWWGLPCGTLDRATSMLPMLAKARSDQIGFDFALAYPTAGLMASGLDDDQLRPALCRAINRYEAEVFAGCRDRLEPVAVVPMVTPDEAVAELDFAIGVLGLKAVVMSGVIRRRVGTEEGQIVEWLDHLGHEASYDYDPVWQRCLELGVVPTFHANGAGWGSRRSTSNYVYNHLGDFASAQEATCRSLFLGGVFTRFPDLRFAFLEGGISWAAQLFSDLIGHYQKRNKDAVRQYDPARVDVTLFEELFRRYASGPMASYAEAARSGLALRQSHPEQAEVRDDFLESGISSIDDIIEVFTTQLNFGCEADDALTSIAFSDRLLPKGSRLSALLSSDIGHWDVPESDGVLEEAWEAVEDGLLTPEDFRDFSCDNAVRMLTQGNPNFFDGTAVEGIKSAR